MCMRPIGAVIEQIVKRMTPGRRLPARPGEEKTPAGEATIREVVDGRSVPPHLRPRAGRRQGGDTQPVGSNISLMRHAAHGGFAS